MLRSAFRCAALVSLLATAAGPAFGVRPRYGGTLRVEVRTAIPAIDPESEPADPREAAARSRFLPLAFEGLVRVDGSGRLQPALATEWIEQQGGREWRFRLREEVVFHDGLPLDAETVAACLRVNLPGRTVEAAGGEVVITSETPAPDLPVELAMPSYCVWRRSDGGNVLGTGPFRITGWEDAAVVEFGAHEEHWAGRPFLDRVTLRMGRTQRERLLSLESGRADVIELGIEGAGVAAGATRATWESEPVELLALVWDRETQPETAAMREALARSVDRQAIHGVIFQGQGKPAAALLPEWLSGYEFLFETPRERPSAGGSARNPIPLVYSAERPLEKAAAERIALDARSAGIALRPVPVPWDGDDAVRLRRVRVAAPRAAAALRRALAELNLPPQDPGSAIEDVYAAETALLSEHRVIPLLHLPERYGVGLRVRVSRGPAILPGGGWRLEEVWLEAPHP